MRGRESIVKLQLEKKLQGFIQIFLSLSNAKKKETKSN
jgi:hypothetical protein